MTVANMSVLPVETDEVMDYTVCYNNNANTSYKYAVPVMCGCRNGIHYIFGIVLFHISLDELRS